MPVNYSGAAGFYGGARATRDRPAAAPRQRRLGAADYSFGQPGATLPPPQIPAPPPMYSVPGQIRPPLDPKKSPYWGRSAWRLKDLAVNKARIAESQAEFQKQQARAAQLAAAANRPMVARQSFVGNDRFGRRIIGSGSGAGGFNGGGNAPMMAGGIPDMPQGFPPELMSLLQNAQAGEDSAKAANESRYQEILTGFRGRHSTALGELDKFGGMQRRAIDDQHTKSLASVDQDMIDRGLGNTTLRNSARNDLGEVRGRLLGDLEERLARQRLDVGAQLSGDTLGFMERRDDVSADPALTAQIAAALGEGGIGVWGGVMPQSATGAATPGSIVEPSGPGLSAQQRQMQLLRQMLAGAGGAKLGPNVSRFLRR